MAFAGSEDLVAAAEAMLGRRLPDPLRQRLIRENGGEIEAAGDVWMLYPVWDDTDRRTVARTANHIVRENEVLRHDWPDLVPAGHLAIAGNDAGDLLLVGSETDHILWRDHETGRLTIVSVRWDSPPTSD